MSACIRAGKKAKVILSQVTDVYQNLALENWILNNWNFARFNCLLVYQNTPCLVIGRFQNTWREVNVPLATQAGVPIARRVSGGGTVYHDLGNINFSFFSDKKSHCPPSNLAFLSGVLNEKYNMGVNVNKRHDLYIGERKISGSASRLIRNSSFHHCTLLVNSDLSALCNLLRGDPDIVSSATTSLSSPTTSLCEEHARHTAVTSRDSIATSRVTSLSPRDIIDNVAESYLSLYDGTDSEQIGYWSGEQFCDSSVLLVDQIPGHVTNSEHVTDNWIFGKSPKFTRTFTTLNGGVVTVTIDKGSICEVTGSCDLVDLLGLKYDVSMISDIVGNK